MSAMDEFNAMSEQLKKMSEKNHPQQNGEYQCFAVTPPDFDESPDEEEKSIYDKYDGIDMDSYSESPLPKINQEVREEKYPEIENAEDFLFEGGPLISEVESWKKQYDSVYIVDDLPGDLIFIYRTLNRFEYKSIMAQPNTDPLMREEMLCQICVLFPYEFSYGQMANMDAGVPSILAEHIMQTSGFVRGVEPKRL